MYTLDKWIGCYEDRDDLADFAETDTPESGNESTEYDTLEMMNECCPNVLEAYWEKRVTDACAEDDWFVRYKAV